MNKNLLKKIALLNQTTLDSLAEKNSLTIIKNFTEAGIKILEADFGFGWWKFHSKEKYKLVYKSPKTPYEPTIPRNHAGNYIARKTKKPFFDSHVKKENYLFDIDRYLKSYAIVPICYNDNIYGNLVLCFKKERIFKEEDKELMVFLGNVAAQAITTARLVEKERELVLMENTKRLLQEEKLKTEFIANASHEIRTPLAIIKGTVDLVLMKGLSDTRMLKVINHEVNHLSKILSDLSLLITDTHKVKNKTSFEPVNVLKIIKHTTNTLKIIAKQKNISIIFNKVLDVFVLGDQTSLEKLFANLIRNAITYGKKNGWIRIDVIKKKNTVEIKISDNGIGIMKKDLPYIFDRFYRANTSRTPESYHLGLGLAIVKSIALVHKGNISVKSEVNKGTIFTVSFPIFKLN